MLIFFHDRALSAQLIQLKHLLWHIFDETQLDAHRAGGIFPEFCKVLYALSFR